MLKQALQQLMAGKSLNVETMTEVMGKIIDGECSPVQMSALLIALHYKGESVDEIVGAAKAMRQRMQTINVKRRPLIDPVGTGGDGAHTFNISTATALLIAACGVAVAKHGNRSVSSKCGSADVLEALGLHLEAPLERVAHSVETIGIGFLYAPLFHQGMRHAAPVRKELGIRTLFNILGPLTNPAGAPFQLLGVWQRSLTTTLAKVLANLGSQRVWVVHGLDDGLDEISLCGPTHVAAWDGNQVKEFQITPEDVSLKRCQLQDLQGGDAQDNAQIMRQLLQGHGEQPMADAVTFNAGAALHIANHKLALADAIEQAQTILNSGIAYELLQKMIEMSHTDVSGLQSTNQS